MTNTHSVITLSTNSQTATLETFSPSHGRIRATSETSKNNGKCRFPKSCEAVVITSQKLFIQKPI